MPLRHRSLQKSGSFFITTSTYQRVVRFFAQKHYDELTRLIEYYRNRNNALIHGYVLMPNHLHLIISIPDAKSISDYMRDLKKRVAFEAGNTETGRARKFWQDRFDDFYLSSTKVYLTKLNYIHNNPVKAGLVAEAAQWPYSSAGFYWEGLKSKIEVTHFV